MTGRVQARVGGAVAIAAVAALAAYLAVVGLGAAAEWANVLGLFVALAGLAVSAAGVLRTCAAAVLSVEPPRLVGAIPSQAACFVDREIAVEFDCAIRARGGKGARSTVLSGLGGVGKTQLAAAFARRALDNPRFGLVMWVDASSRDSVISTFAEAATVGDTDGQRTEHDAKRFLAWLVTFDQPWLVVLDDLVDLTDLEGLWPLQVSRGWTVITSRRRDAALIRGRQLINVGPYSEAEAMAYIIAALADKPALADDIDGLAGDLRQLPLALSHATAYMLDRNLRCSSYRRRFNDQKRQLSKLFPERPVVPDDYGQTVSVAWSISIDYANRLEPVGLAKPLLELASMLAPQGIPVAVLTTSAARWWLYGRSRLYGGHSVREVDREAVYDGLHCLRRFNLATLDGDTVSVHPLVQRATRDQVPPDQRESIVSIAADTLAEAWPPTEPDRRLCQALRTNAAAIEGNPCGTSALWNGAMHPILMRAGRSLGESGQARTAFDYFQQLCIKASTVYGDDHPDTLAARHGRARWQGVAGDLAGAEAAFHSLVSDTQRVFGPAGLETLAARGNLAYWQGMAGDPAGAAAAFEELLADMERIYGPDDPDTLATRHGRAWCQGMAGEPEAATVAFEELLADMERVYGPDDPTTLATRHAHAWWQGITGKPKAAATSLRALLADAPRALGEDHHVTLTARANLGYWQAASGDRAGVIAALRELLADARRALGEDHHVTLTARANLGYWQAASGDRAGAIAALRELLADARRALGEDHHVTLTTRRILAHWRAGNDDDAAAELQELLAGQIPVLGPAHPSQPIHVSAIVYGNTIIGIGRIDRS